MPAKNQRVMLTITPATQAMLEVLWSRCPHLRGELQESIQALMSAGATFYANMQIRVDVAIATQSTPQVSKTEPIEEEEEEEDDNPDFF